MKFYKLPLTKIKCIVLTIALICIIGCTYEIESSITQGNNTISGYVIDEPVEGAEVYIDFEDGTFSTKVITNSDGFYELKLSDADLTKINPEIPKGVDGCKTNLLLVASKNGRTLRNALTRNVAEGQTVFITNDTEAYAQYLECIGHFNTIALTEFNSELEKGRIIEASEKSTFIKDIREDVKAYFYGGEKPTASSIFEKALTHLGKDKVALVADDSSYIPSRNVMSGGDILLPNNIIVESDEITLVSKGQGRFTVGNGFDNDLLAYLKIQNVNIYSLVPIFIKTKQVTSIANEVVTPQKGTTIGTEFDSISIDIPPFSVSENKVIAFDKIETQGETADGLMILEMKPSGLKFDLPITVRVKYSEFGVMDPLLVEWKYGSVDGGYINADIISIDNNNKNIYLNLNHFSDLVVRRVKSQKYLDLGENHILQIPRRNHYLVPTATNKKIIQEQKQIISNRLFEGCSTSNLQGSDNTPSGGGQCVQFADNVYYPLKIKKKLNINQAYVNINSGLMPSIYNYLQTNREIPDGVREQACDCLEGDVVAVDSGGGTGHIAIFKSFANNKLTLIQSNDDSSVLTMYGPNKEYRTDSSGYHERFTFGNIHGDPDTSYAITISNNVTTMTRPSNSSNTFVCLNPTGYDFDEINYSADDYKTVKVDGEKTGNGYTNDTYATTYGYEVNIKPWMYYLLDTEKDGVAIYNEKNGAKYYGYDPDILPVAALKLDENFRMTSDVESRYEIYISDAFHEGSEFRLTSFSNAKSQEAENEGSLFTSDTSLNFDGNIFEKLEQSNTGQTEFKLIPMNGVEDFTSRFELRVDTSDNTVDNRKKILFSPTTIDDYYINWSTNNLTYDTSKILIGFWNSNGSNMPLQNENGILPTILELNSIYKSVNALNGYFITLDSGKSAEWHFTLAGKHTIMVNIPTGKYSDIEHTVYKLHNLEYKEHEITLKPQKFKKALGKTSAFENWFLLYQETSNHNTYEFDLTGNEFVSATQTDSNPAVIDAIRLQSVKTIISDAVAKGTIRTINELNHTLALKVQIQVLKEECSFFNTCRYEEVSTLTLEDGDFSEGVYYELQNLGKGKYKLIYTLLEKTVTREYQTKSKSDSSSIAEYKAESLHFEINSEDESKQLPPVIITNSTYIDNFTLNLTDQNGSVLQDVNIDIKAGINNDSEIIAFSGITNSSGQLIINEMPCGQYTAIFSLCGYRAKTVNFIVSNTEISYESQLIEAVGSDLSGKWISDSNHVPNVPQGAYKNLISIREYGDKYQGTYKSIYSWYPDNYCGLLTSVSETNFTAIVQGNYLDLTFTSDSGYVRKECNGSWVSALEFSKDTTLRLILNSNNSGVLSIKDENCGWSHEGFGCVEQMPLFYKF